MRTAWVGGRGEKPRGGEKREKSVRDGAAGKRRQRRGWVGGGGYVLGKGGRTAEFKVREKGLPG
jgi:hypothetical protein